MSSTLIRQMPNPVGRPVRYYANRYQTCAAAAIIFFCGVAFCALAYMRRKISEPLTAPGFTNPEPTHLCPLLLPPTMFSQGSVREFRVLCALPNRTDSYAHAQWFWMFAFSSSVSRTSVVPGPKRQPRFGPFLLASPSCEYRALRAPAHGKNAVAYA